MARLRRAGLGPQTNSGPQTNLGSKTGSGPQTNAGSKTKTLSALALGALGLLTLIMAGCSTTQPMDTFTADAGPSSERITNLFWPILIVAIVIMILVEGAIIYMIRRFRARRRAEAVAATAAATATEAATPTSTLTTADPYDPDNPIEITGEPLPPQTHGNLRLEIAWTIIPTIILAIIAGVTLVAIFDLEEVTASDDSLRVTVVGQQWWWEFQYHMDGNTETTPDFVTAGELVIPVGQQVPLEITSRDVIHSYWIPQLIGKKDAVPGRYHDWTIEAYRPGRYLGACTEFCGLAHGYMRMYTVALPEGDWVDWAANQLQPAELLEPGEQGYGGQELFQSNCARCHSISGVTDTNGDDIVDDPSIYSGGEFVQDQLVAGAAPDLTHLMSRATFAGASYDLYEGRGEDLPYQDLARAGELNAVDLERWIVNAPANKPADWQGERGMPPFPNLTADDVDALVEYLRTLA